MMTRGTPLHRAGRVGLVSILAVPPGIAFAHHFMGNQVPATFLQGLLSGLGHPLIGLDHAAFIIASGILLALVSRGLWGVLTLLVGSLLGALLHLKGVVLPSAEVAVAASVLMVGTLLLLRPRIGLGSAAALALGAGLLHGYAYAETIVGAEATPLVAYLLGFSVTQFVVAAAAFGLHRVARRERPARAAAGCAAVGAVVMVVGAAFLVAV